MQITRNTIETTTGPSEWFTGAVYVDTVGAIPPRGRQWSLHARRSYRLAHPPERPEHLRNRGRRTMPAPWRADRGDPCRRPGVLRAG